MGGQKKSERYFRSLQEENLGYKELKRDIVFETVEEALVKQKKTYRKKK